MLKLTNTLTKLKEDFVSLNNKNVGMYNCGPTVYDYAHIGNLRSYVFADILRRTLEYGGYNVTQVINITDIGHLSGDGDDGEDKMTKGLMREGKPLSLAAMKEMAEFYTDKYIDDLKALNIELPSVLPRASDHIKEDIDLIKRLFDKDFIYQTSDGLYFDTIKDKSYGKLGGLSEMLQARIETNTEKHSPRDFAVWKFNDSLGYESPWGKGFPGWHIECSAMSMKYLGESFDIHTGGIDHIPVHHNNEIAQSESATGKPYARFWLHNAFVTVPGGKMAKSEGNTLHLKDLISRGISPLSYRYWLLTAHYSRPITFSFEAVEAAGQAYARLQRLLEEYGPTGTIHQNLIAQFKEIVENDLDTAGSLALVWQITSDSSLSPADKKATIMDMDRILGLKLGQSDIVTIPNTVHSLVAEREKARQEKNWQRADELRQEITKNGFEVKDTEDGPQVYKR